MIVSPTRRAFLGAIPFTLGAQVKSRQKKPKQLPNAGEFVRIVDPVTENLVIRLTNVKTTSLLPCARNRFVSVREHMLVFSSDRNGRLAPFQIDLRNGAIRQIAEASQLNSRSLSLERGDKAIRYLDAGSLMETEIGRGSPRTVAEDISSFSNSQRGPLFLISRGNLVVADDQDPQGRRVLAGAADDLWAQPNGQGCLFARKTGSTACELYYVPANGSAKPIFLLSGNVRDPFWDADGESILFLRDVVSDNGTILAEIHGRSITGGEEYIVSWTSQFASFAPNSDTSVFVGASRSKAQPNVVLMLRWPHREMTLCEHRAANPTDVMPVFSPDNRRIYFESDKEGRSAIYSVNVELLVEPQMS